MKLQKDAYLAALAVELISLKARLKAANPYDCNLHLESEMLEAQIAALEAEKENLLAEHKQANKGIF